MRVYLAGPSKELPRIVAIRNALVAAGHTITSRWIDIILAEGSEHDPASTITEERLIECAEINLHDVTQAEMLVYVPPLNRAKSEGAASEFGYQLRANRDRIVVFQEPGQFVQLFALLAHRVDSMDKLLAYLEGWETSAKAYEAAMPSAEWP